MIAPRRDRRSRGRHRRAAGHPVQRPLRPDLVERHPGELRHLHTSQQAEDRWACRAVSKASSTSSRCASHRMSPCEHMFEQMSSQPAREMSARTRTTSAGGRAGARGTARRVAGESGGGLRRVRAARDHHGACADALPGHPQVDVRRLPRSCHQVLRSSSTPGTATRSGSSSGRQAGRKTWWHNLREPADVDLWVAGKRVRARAVVVSGSADPTQAAAGLAAYRRAVPRAPALGLPPAEVVLVRADISRAG